MSGTSTVKNTVQGYGVSLQQERLWLLGRGQGNASHDTHGVVALDGILDPAILKTAISHVVERHEILRTMFHDLPGMALPIQVIAEVSDFSYEEHDLTAHEQGEQEAQIEILTYASFVSSHDLSGSVLPHFVLVKLSPVRHVLLISLPVGCSDGRTLNNLVREVNDIYTAQTAGREVSIEIPLQYADFAEWQQASLEDEDGEIGRMYWRKQADSIFAEIQNRLSFEYVSEDSLPFVPGRIAIPISLEVTQRITDATKQYGLSHSTFLLGCWCLMLQRFIGQLDVVVGVAQDGRAHDEMQEAFGPFAKYVPVYSKVDETRSFNVYLDGLQNRVLEGEEWQEYFSWNDIERVDSEGVGERFFPFCFEFDELDSQYSASALSFKIESTHSYIDQFKVRLVCARQGDTIIATLHYDASRYQEAMMACFAEQLGTVVDHVSCNPEVTIGDIEMMSETERHRVLVSFNESHEIDGQVHGLHRLFEAQVARTPKHIAVAYEQWLLTYEELNRRANQLAHNLIHRGVGCETAVGVCLERSPDLIVALLGILKAGGAYVPIDPSYPKGRIGYMLEDSGALLVLTQKSLRGNLPETSAVIVDLDWVEGTFSEYSDLPPSIPEMRDSVAYVIYTSGSTGRPKGVLVHHRNVVYSTLARLNYYHETVSSFLLLSSFAFDSSVAGIFWTLSRGGKLCLPREGLQSDSFELGRLIEREQVTHVLCLPSLYSLLLDQVPIHQLRSLRFAIVAGETCPRDLVIRHYEQCPLCELFNEYGPTEGTVWSSVSHCGCPDESRAVSIGHPIVGMKIYLLDSELKPVPIGMPGEVHITGEGLTRGYHKRPALTAEKFIPNPFAAIPDSRLYKTGDVARFRPDGNIEFIGRRDQQVKIRGYRIELGEIQARLVEHPGVQEAVVVSRASRLDEGQLVAYVVLGDFEQEISDVREFLGKQLPAYMVPAQWVQLSALPLTPNGKVDRKALPDPEGAAQVSGQYVAPRTPTEEILARIWAEVLGIERVGVHDNFFELGGHSLLGVRLIEHMRQAGLHATVRALLTTPTVASLAVSLESDADQIVIPPNGIPADCDAIKPTMLPLVALTPANIACIVEGVTEGARNIQDLYPLAPLQEGMLFHHQLDQAGDPYLFWAQLRFDTRARVDGFIQTLQLVITRHDILRTAVWWEDLPEPVQVVWRDAPVIVDEFWFDESGGEITEQLRAHYDARHYRMDVRQAPLIHGGMVQDPATGQWLFQLLWHHLIGDHLTVEILMSEIEAIQQGQESQLPTPVPFRNFIVHVRHGLQAAEHKAFFTEMLKDIDEPTLPFGLWDVQGDGSEIEEAGLPVEPRLEARVRQYARRLRVSVGSLLHLAWGQVLGRLSGQQHVVFGTVLLGRMHGEEGADRIPGLFMNTLPIRIDIGEQGVADSVWETHLLLTHLLEHEHASLALAQRCSGVASSVPLFTALFNYRHNFPSKADRPMDAESAWEGIEELENEERTNYPVSLHIDDDGSSLVLTAQVAAQGQADRVCEFMHTTLENLVGALETAPDTPVQSIEVMPDCEQQHLLDQWNATEKEWEGGIQNVVELFDAQVARAPAAIAIEMGGELVTYAELDARANRVAQDLHALGVGPEVLVGICLERSVEMLVGLMGVWKAGGAYVPLDPSYPKARLALILADANPAVLVTQQAWRDTLPCSKAHVLCLDEDRAGSPSCSVDDRCLPVKLQHDSLHMAYVIYTSGSTGRPKGVMISHRSAINFLAAMRESLQPTEHDRFLAVTSLSFDISLLELCLPLMVGARVMLVDTETTHDGLRLLDRVEESGVTLMQATPATWRMLLDGGWKGKPGMKVLCGGEAMTAELASELLTRDMPLWNLYGPTETTVWSAIQAVHHATESIPIGRPIANTQMYILDAHLRPVPRGVIGAIYIGGAGLARGYWGRAELTAERFIPHLFSNLPGSRLYETGDEGRYRADGTIDFLGRRDHQVKIRGHRIEIGEIEAHLRDTAGIQEAVVVVREDIPGDKRLVGYVVGVPDVETDLEAVKATLREQVPEYMVPAMMVGLESLPLTPNGKINRNELPAPDVNGQLALYVAPRTPTEETLTRIWAEVLGVETVGVHDNFFDAGGHSLLAVQVLSRLRKVFKIEISLRDFFERSTIAEGAKFIEKQLIQKLEGLSESEAQSLLK